MNNNDFKNFLVILVLLIILITRFNYIKTKYPNLFVKEKGMSEAEYNKNYDMCMEQYETKQYEDAAFCFKKLVEEKDIPNTRYMYAVSVGLAKNYSDAVAVLEGLMNSKKTDENTKTLAKKALEEFLKYKNDFELLERSDMGNYMGELERVATWKNSEKLKVYIYDDYNKKAAIKKAFIIWDNKLRSMVNFVYVDNPKDADITAKAVNISELEKDRAGITDTEHYCLSDNENKFYMQKADVKISYNNPKNVLWSDGEFQSIALHEIGHALGILDHSKSRKDIMYFDVSVYRKGILSNRDINTVKRIYTSLF